MPYYIYVIHYNTSKLISLSKFNEFFNFHIHNLPDCLSIEPQNIHGNNQVCLNQHFLFFGKKCKLSSGECGMGIKPHECANLFGEVTAKRYTCPKTEHRETLKTTKTMKIKRKSIKCKKYDNDLCKFIIEYIEENQEEQIDQGKRFTNRNPKDRLKEYLLPADKSKEVPLQMWQMVATACSLFLDKTMFTHYVSGIKLGARQQESTNSKECGTKAACGAGVNACQGASFSAQGQYQIESERNVSTKEEIGVIDEHSNDVTKEEVIEVTLTPVFELIEHDALHVIMQALLRCHQQGSKGTHLPS